MTRNEKETSGAATPEATFKAQMDDLTAAQKESNRAFSQGRQFGPLRPQGQTASDLKRRKSEFGHRLRQWLGIAGRQVLRFARIRKSKTAE